MFSELNTFKRKTQTQLDLILLFLLLPFTSFHRSNHLVPISLPVSHSISFAQSKPFLCDPVALKNALASSRQIRRNVLRDDRNVSFGGGEFFDFHLTWTSQCVLKILYQPRQKWEKCKSLIPSSPAAAASVVQTLLTSICSSAPIGL